MALRVSIMALLLAACFCILPARAQVAPQETPPHALERKLYRDNASQYPLLTQHKIDDLLRIRLDDNQLALEPVLEADREYQQKRAELDGFPEPAVILCFLVSQDLGQVQFEFTLDDYADPAVIGRLHVQARPNASDTGKLLESIDIEKTWHTSTGERRVFFSQTNTQVTLSIAAGQGGLFDNAITTTITEKDFATLRRSHHDETERWLRPILHELHQEAAFAADADSAWQVLSSDWPLDEKMKPAVLGKIHDLDSDDFRVRLAAANALEKLGRDAALVMMRLDRRGMSLEQNLLVDEVISHFKPLKEAEAQRLHADAGFLLDCLYGDDAIARKLAFEQLRAITKQPFEFDINAPEAQRMNAVNILREKVLGANANPNR